MMPHLPKMSALTLLGLIPLVWCQTTTQSPQSPQDKTEHVLTQTMDALEQGLDFMQQNQQDINLDGVIGTRLVEGQLEMLLQRLQVMAVPRVSVAAQRQLVELRTKASAVSDAALPSVMTREPTYYARVGALIQKGYWTQYHASRDVDPDLVAKPVIQGEAMNEQDSDDCLTELFGTSGQTSQPCHVSRFCWKLMSSPGYRGYSLSHQLFYMLNAEASECIPEGQQADVDHLSAGLCANMMVEAETIARDQFPLENQDLFMEIQALCGVAGFRGFFRDDWLEKILSWQWEQGCWGKKHAQGVPGGMSKREERVLAEGCLSHRTSVAISALVQNIRYIIEVLQKTPPPKYF